MIELDMNYSVICVDDEDGIIEAYRNVLGGFGNLSDEVDDSLARRRKRRGGEEVSDNCAVLKKLPYHLFFASSGEEAVDIVTRELNAGRQIAAGFFDMVMPGGMDGKETIKRILQLDDQMLCAVVTAYTDRSPEQLSSLFKRQDNWLFFNKPFSIGELSQTAYHLVTAWNQRRREEVLVSNLELMQKGLFRIIEMVSDMNKIPPMMVNNLLKGILNHFLTLVGTRNGFVVMLTEQSNIYFGSGIFEGSDDFSDLTHKPQWDMAKSAMEEKHSILVRNMVATPLVIDKEIAGVLFVQKENNIIEQDSKLIDIYAIQALNMIRQSSLYKKLDDRNLELNKKNQEIINIIGKLTKAESLRSEFEKLSYIDSLSGLPNRRYFESKCREELNRASRHDFFVSCLMLDVDFFKKVNDVYGHAAGDYVIREIGDILNDCKRTYDVVCRYGGEEFAMLLMQISIEDAEMVTERIRATIEKHEFIFEDQRIDVTASIGSVTFVPTGHDTMETMIQQADDALYKAKEEGRNRCCFV